MMILPWILGAPAIGVLLIAFFAHKKPRIASLISCSAVGASFLLSVVAVAQLAQLPPENRRFEIELFTWIQAGTFNAPFGLLLDALSSVMILVVTGVGSLIHIYSIGYMKDDPNYSRFFAYLNLFIFSMLTLVLANNYVLLFVGWELVGLCSYLLIGFWFEKKSAADAGKKAFIVNRIGDLGFLIGIFTLFYATQSVRYQDIFQHVSTMTPALITAASLWLFCGAIGKSAQFPLYVWLPDAMEGPTPVSALIHAATMVTAGVYMVARSFPLYSQSETAMLVVAATGSFTAIFAASMALTQFDIKRVLAYSTISQLGYMFMALGVGSFAAAIFHLVTHAFFKALLFLSAGSIMHAMHHEIDFRKMGGLKKPLGKTFHRFMIGGLALAGIFPFAGFFSKDAILLGAFISHPYGRILWGMGVVTACMTAYYTFRVIYRAFYGEPRDHHLYEHAHESPAVMIAPLSVLAVLSIIGGWIGTPWMDVLGRWLEPVLPAPAHEVQPATEYWLMGFSLSVALVGILIAWYFHRRKTEVADRLETQNPIFSRIHSLLFHKWYVDELYNAVFVRPILWISEKVLFRVIDVSIIDGIINDVGSFLRGAGGVSRRMQTGDARAYAAAILLGTLGLIVYFAYSLWKVNG